jgi:hypothetical protein
LQKESADRNLKKTHAGASTAEPDDKASEGGQAASSLADLITQLAIIHEPKPQFTGSHELNICINPLEETEYFVLNMPQQVLWAKAIVSTSFRCFNWNVQNLTVFHDLLTAFRDQRRWVLLLSYLPALHTLQHIPYGILSKTLRDIRDIL